MDFGSFFENVKEKIVSLYERVADYCRNNKRNAILFACLFVCILLLIIILASIPRSRKNRHTEQKEIVLTEDLLIPDGPELHRDYNISRQTIEKWSEEQAEEWFTIPSQKDIESLEKANDNIIMEITGAAP